MIGTILWWLAASLGTGLLGFAGYKGVKKLRARKNRKAKAEILGAFKATKTARAMSARGQVRTQRKAQPKRLTFGHRRTPDDPTRLRQAVNRAKVAKANKTATKVDTPKATPVTQRILEAVNPTVTPIPGRRTEQQVEDTMTTCQAFTTDGDGTCRRPAKHDDQGNTLFHCGIPSHARQFAGRKAVS
jgi:hypothetical protein